MASTTTVQNAVVRGDGSVSASTKGIPSSWSCTHGEEGQRVGQRENQTEARCHLLPCLATALKRCILANIIHWVPRLEPITSSPRATEAHGLYNNQ